MTENLLVEIGLEEMPAHVVDPSILQFEEKTKQFLQENHLDFAAVNSFSTPRRLAVQVIDLAEKQADTKEEVKGPAKKIALDENGDWSKAAQGFVRGQGMSTDDIYFKEVKDTEYVYVTKHTVGKNALEILPALKEVITSLTFPVTMHWNKFEFEYIRPIRWLVALLGEQIVPFDILDVSTGRTTYGHRFLGGASSLENADMYEEKLQEQFVIANRFKRQAMISQQIQEIANKYQWQIDVDEDLLEEVNNLVEYPTAFVGDFAEKYLRLPDEVLITSMKEHQRYFDVKSQDGKLLPHFISVRNGNQNKIDNVVKGNEKVLVARLEDAEFFYNEDQKLSIEECVDKLKNVTFHEKIGSMYEKMQRVQLAAKIIGKHINLSDTELADLQRAAQIYKFDLVTNMVDEFPELQGIMGEKYALLKGEKPAVAQAIREHYMPVASEGELPSSNIGAVLAIADKLDSLFSFFAAGLKPKSSSDPYALRRQTYGIVRILAAKHWSFPFTALQQKIEEMVNQNEEFYGIHLEDPTSEVGNFLRGRLRQFLSAQNFRYDVIDAVIDARQEDIHQLIEAANTLKKHLNDEDFKSSIEALTRVMNLGQKDQSENEIDPTLFENEAEQNLYQAVKKLEEQFASQTVEENYHALTQLRPLIEDYFDQTMVMTDNEEVRHNRLAQLRKITQMAIAVASLNDLVTK
ncbi:glycine--tRNA ligase subunit beta [Tetragenococcus halophilus]|uniref:glycine--tRNA ligase subunit beta n=1 Tax=Tetragenococcus halophilus TaxID=51669 RepID=UPI001F46909F|nr:glycine--tRNA ligase subunit beta [Tetragenococcus halophilus]MCF1684392.1 glycine--tRNA ligase subunit beta [Tetragenococcus halophilus]